MIIPQNGRVVIIDDKLDQAYPLIKLFSKHKIPFTYHSDDVLLLPEAGSPYDDIRLLILDINLSADGTPEETIISQLQTTLTRIIKPNTIYIAIIWSLKENEYKGLLEELFVNRIPQLSPLRKIYITKSEFFDLDVTDDGTIYTERSDIDIFTELNNRIKDYLNELDALEALVKWENIINDSSSLVINEIASLANGNNDFNVGLKSIYYKLAEATWGKQIKGIHHHEIVNKAVSVMNYLLNDQIDAKISKGIAYSLIKEIDEPEIFQEADKATLNSKILLDFNSIGETIPGDVFFLDGEEANTFPFKALIADLLNVPYTVEEFYKEKNGELPPVGFSHVGYKNEFRKDYSKFEKRIRDEISAKSHFVWIELSPICDYAQKKIRLNRICPGILWNNTNTNFIGAAESLYVSPVVEFNGQVYRMVIDLRYFTSYTPEIFQKRKSVFTLRHSFLVDIQSQLGRHINRPGISALT